MSRKTEAVADIINNLRRVIQVVNEQSKRAEFTTGLTGPQLWAIKVIADAGPLSVSELAGRMFVHPATVVGIIDRLEGHGLVGRERSREDRRVVHVDLTDSGRRLLTDAPQVAQGLLVEGLEVLTGAELQSIASGLGQLVRILGAQKLPPQFMLSPEDNTARKKTARVKASKER
ncbi:MAG TPA: MarR family transcriptional regulator [Deltaproteobacteria bacterium]|jgi:DNA-binding MarR family transcriptional regulator|nr:MarR family transcriptional regulator [Deltaproteobacteria bacterium]HOI08176.1 MarR family transcriptional regulator [Deltaproteobacteria bacterium]